MALFFDLQKLQEDSKGNAYTLMSLLEYQWNKKQPRGIKVPFGKSYTGNNFLLNPSPLFISTVDVSYKIQYVKLCALRDWFLYKTHGVTTLDLSYFPDVNVNLLKHNPLLTITNNTIRFKFEELHNGSKIWRNKG